MRLLEVLSQYEPALLARLLDPRDRGAGAPSGEGDLLRRLADPDRLRALWPQLPPESREVLRWLRQAGGRMPAFLLGILYEIRRADPAAPAFEEVGIRLAAAGLVYWRYPGRRVRSFLPQGEAVLPEEVAAALPPLESIDGLRWIPASPQRLARDLGRYGRFLRRHPGIALTREGRLPVRWVRQLGRWLGGAAAGPDGAYIVFLHRILERMGVIRTQGAALVVEPLHPFWEQPPAERAWAAFQAWRGEAVLEAAENPLSREALRAGIEAALRQWEPGAWIPLPALLVAAWPHGPERLPDPLSPAGREQAEAFRRWLIEETLWPLHWLGVLDLGLWEGQWEAVRLTPFGAWALGVGAPVAFPEENGRLVVQPDFRILAFEPLPEATRAALEAFADPVPGDTVSIYLLSRESVYRGLQEGWEVPRILEFLEGLSGEPLPPNVRRSLEDWHRRFRQIRIYPRVTLVRTAGEALPPGEGLRPLGETMGWTWEGAETLRARWRMRGIRPWVTGFRPEDLRHQVVADASGRLRWTGPFPHPGVAHLLAPFAEPTPEGFQITRDSLRAGQAAGLSLSEILQRLQHVHRGPLPVGLVARLLAWSEPRLRARWEPVILLRMERTELLEALAQEPELAPWVRLLDAHTLMVRADHAPALKAWLEAMGISVEEV
ncbi:helicase-associated domain-containing protein [Thermoflexus sp.]|uniref:helicase-associated domain-containing protein n=1 Tax=Thermoflexus sp. TaxID=1969742 RepID=UPI003331C06B